MNPLNIMVYNFLGCMDFAVILGAPSPAVDRGCIIIILVGGTSLVGGTGLADLAEGRCLVVGTADLAKSTNRGRGLVRGTIALDDSFR
jgi:hypothetical protein